jgi:acyl-CoA synthetase (AMP-forming)/AMP-acid ligase II
MSVFDLFVHGAERFPDRPFLTDAESSISYAEADRAILEFARALHASGLKPGDRVALLTANSAAAMVAILAIYRAGCVFVPLNASLSIEEHLSTIHDLDVAMLLFGASFEDAMSSSVARIGQCALICIDGEPTVGISRQALIARHALAPFSEPARSGDEVCAIYPTGGSTGKPKRVMHTHLIWETMAASFLTALPVQALPTYLMMSPITHAAGTFALMLMPLGAHVIIHEGFDPKAILSAIEEDHVTHLFLPPTAIYKLLAYPFTAGRDFSSLHAFIYSAAPMSVEKLSECIAIFGPVMVQFWGQMEAPSFLTCLTAQDHVEALANGGGRLASCGRETLFTRIGVMDDEGRLLAARARGELVVRGSLVMKGYYDNPDATTEASRFGWHHTGDLGFKDDAGYVHIVGRKSDMIISGGFNVYPVDVEQVLWSHPAVEECAVIGVPHDIWGEAVHAIVQLKPGETAESDELIAFCRQRLGGVRTPKCVDFRAELPRNAVGKIDKQQLRRPFWEGRPRSI